MTVERIRISDRATWLALRKRDITASDVAAICGFDRYRTAMKVWAEKTGRLPPMEDNPTLRRGRWLEAGVIEALREERPTWKVERANVYLRDPEICLGATPDAVAIDPERPGIGAIQCKVIRRDVFEEHWTDLGDGLATAPLAYQIQTLTEGMLLQASWLSVVALVLDSGSGAHFVEAPLTRHPEAEDKIRQTVDRFWQDTRAGIEPTVDYGRDGEVIRALYPEDHGTETDLAGDHLPEILAERAALKDRIKADAARVEAIETEIRAKMGTHERAFVPGFRVAWSTQERAGGYQPPSTTRILRITPKKG